MFFLTPKAAGPAAFGFFLTLLKFLRAFGVNDNTITFERATAALNYITGQRRRQQLPQPDVIGKILHRRRDPGEEG